MGSSIAARNTAFRFDADPRQVANVRDALNNLFNAINFQGGYEGAEVAANGVIAGLGTTSARVLAGRVLTDNGQRRLITIPAAGLTADYTLAADQAGDGVGGAFAAPVGAPPAAGTFLALHIIVRRNGTTRLAFTNVAPIPEDSVPTFVTPGSNLDEIGSKILAILALREDGAAGNELAPAWVTNSGSDIRRYTYQNPDGDLSSQASSDQDVAAGAASNPVTLNGIPVSDVIRSVVATIECDGTDVGDSAALANFGGDSAVARSRRDVAAQNGPTVSGCVFTDVTGRIITVLHSDAVNAASNVRPVSFDTFMGH